MKSFWIDDSEDGLTAEGVKVSAGLVPAGTTLILTRGMTLHKDVPIVRVKKPSAFNQDVKAVFAKGPLKDGLLPHLLAANKAKLLAAVDAAGHGTGRLLTDALLELTVVIPDPEEQDEIASLANAFEHKIEVNRRMAATLEEMARAVFRSWFVDLDPVRAKVAAKAEGRDPERAAMAALSGKSESDLDTLPPETLASLSVTAALFPDEWADSEIGEIPNGWAVDSIYSVANVIYGAPFSSKLFNESGEGKPLVRIRDLKDESPAISTTEVHRNGYLIQPGDLVVGMDGEFRVYLWGGPEAWLNQRVCVFKPKEGVPGAFLRESLVPLLAKVESFQTATTVIHIGKGDIDRFRTLTPPVDVLKAFGRLTDPLLRLIVGTKRSNRSLASTRDALLPKLLSGELSRSRAEEELALA